MAQYHARKSANLCEPNAIITRLLESSSYPTLLMFPFASQCVLSEVNLAQDLAVSETIENEQGRVGERGFARQTHVKDSLPSPPLPDKREFEEVKICVCGHGEEYHDGLRCGWSWSHEGGVDSCRCEGFRWGFTDYVERRAV
jgi:hypothetical protein